MGDRVKGAKAYKCKVPRAGNNLQKVLPGAGDRIFLGRPRLPECGASFRVLLRITERNTALAKSPNNLKGQGRQKRELSEVFKRVRRPPSLKDGPLPEQRPQVL